MFREMNKIIIKIWLHSYETLGKICMYPSLLMNTEHQLRMVLTRWLYTGHWDNLCHSFSSAFLLPGDRLHSTLCLLIAARTCSMRLSSGENVSNSIQCILSLLIHLLTIRFQENVKNMKTMGIIIHQCENIFNRNRKIVHMRYYTILAKRLCVHSSPFLDVKLCIFD